MATQKPGEWANSLLARFEDQLPYKIGPYGTQARLNQDQLLACLIQISRYRFSLVISNLTKMLQRVNEKNQNCRGHEPERCYYDSLIIILTTLERCLSNQSKDTARFEEAMNVKLLLREISPFFDVQSDSNTNATQLKALASKVLFALSQNHFSAVFNRISAKIQELTACSEENSDYSDIELIQHIDMDMVRLSKLLQETITKFRSKKAPPLILLNSIEKAIWNWIEYHPQEFQDLQRGVNKDNTVCWESLFDFVEAYKLENKKSKTTVWPLQMLLLILSPNSLEAAINELFQPDKEKEKLQSKLQTTTLRDKDLAVKQFIENIKKGIGPHSPSKQVTESSAIACVKLCKALTYINNNDSNHIVFKMVQYIISDLKALLFNPLKPFSRGQGFNFADIELMIECWVSCFRINPHNVETLKVCLSLSSPQAYHFVIVCALLRLANIHVDFRMQHKNPFRLVNQPKLSWWPQTNVMHHRSGELRILFTDTLNKATQGYIAHTPLRMITSLALKSKDAQKGMSRPEEGPAHKMLLLLLVRLIHADPTLLLNTQGKVAHEVQSSTLELINGLVSLVHQPTMPDVAQEAMEALLALHAPEKIEIWNPEAPINTFWDVSSQVLFSISQKLIQHQIANYTDVLKWLREILICRNTFLQRHKDYANVGSQVPICKQAHIKMEVVFFMYLWSVDMDAVLTCLSCLGLLCEEAEICCGSDETSVSYAMPNCLIYQELAQLSTANSDARICLNENVHGNSGFSRMVLQKRIMLLLRKIEHCVNGVQPAWEETFRNWEIASKVLQTYPKCKTEDGQAEIFHRGMGKRRASHQSSEHDLEEQIIEWGNMTWFLLALGGVCLQRPKSSRHHHHQFQSSVSLGSTGAQTSSYSLSSSFSSGRGSFNSSVVTLASAISAPPQDVQYCPVTQFIGQLLRLLVCNNEKIGCPATFIADPRYRRSVTFEMWTIIIDVQYRGHLRDVDYYYDLWKSLSSTSENSVNRRARAIARMQSSLIHAQELGDEKMQIVNQLQELIDQKTRQLDSDQKNLDIKEEQNSSQQHVIRGGDDSIYGGTPQKISRSQSPNGGILLTSVIGIGTSSTSTGQMITGTGKESLCNAFSSALSGGMNQILNERSMVGSNAISAGGSSNGNNNYGNSNSNNMPSSNNSNTASGDGRSTSKRSRRQRNEIVSAMELGGNESNSANEGGSGERGCIVGLSGSGTLSQKQSGSNPSVSTAQKKTQQSGGVGGNVNTTNTGGASGTGGSAHTTKKKKRKARGGQATNTHSNTREDTPPVDPIDPDEPTYCLCDQISFGEMILCDNDLCPIEWFHFSCVSLVLKPKGKWYCPNCRGDRPNVMKPKAQFLKELERYNKEKEEKT